MTRRRTPNPHPIAVHCTACHRDGERFDANLRAFNKQAGQ